MHNITQFSGFMDRTATIEFYKHGQDKPFYRLDGDKYRMDVRTALPRLFGFSMQINEDRVLKGFSGRATYIFDYELYSDQNTKQSIFSKKMTNKIELNNPIFPIFLYLTDEIKKEDIFIVQEQASHNYVPHIPINAPRISQFLGSIEWEETFRFYPKDQTMPVTQVQGVKIRHILEADLPAKICCNVTLSKNQVTWNPGLSGTLVCELDYQLFSSQNNPIFHKSVVNSISLGENALFPITIVFEETITPSCLPKQKCITVPKIPQ